MSNAITYGELSNLITKIEHFKFVKYVAPDVQLSLIQICIDIYVITGYKTISFLFKNFKKLNKVVIGFRSLKNQMRL